MSMDGNILSVPVETPAGTAPTPPADVVITDDGQVVPKELAPKSEEKVYAGKYKSVEELEKGYAELQKKMGAQKAGDSPKIETPPAKTEEQNAEQKGVDLAALSAEFQKNGSLSDAQYADLEKKGFNRDVVDNYIAGQQARAAEFRRSIAETVGGEERLGKVLEWAGSSLPEAEQKAYNDAVASKNEGLVKLALSGIAQKYAAANPTEPTRISGESAASGRAGDSSPYATQSDMMAAINDRRYSEDTGYRKMVERRIMASQF